MQTSTPESIGASADKNVGDTVPILNRDAARSGNACATNVQMSAALSGQGVRGIVNARAAHSNLLEDIQYSRICDR